MALSTIQIVLLSVFTFSLTMAGTPYVLRRLRNAGIFGLDVNKRPRVRVPEMGGIAGVGAIAVAGAVTAVLMRQLGLPSEAEAISITLSCTALGALIGAIDDLYGMRRWKKAVYVSIAGAPIAIAGFGPTAVWTPWFTLDLGFAAFFYWLLVVPLAVTAGANAVNMSAGYNGLETGQLVIMSGALLAVAYVTDRSNPAIPVFALVGGAALGLYFYNRYPAKMFVGDVGTLGLGAGLTAGVVIGGMLFYGILLIIPAMYEFIATLYFSTVKRVERRPACQNPVILKDGRLKPPRGSEWFTLPYRLLSLKPMREARLTNTVLGMYALCAVVAVGIPLLPRLL
jgi:UDP-N-acetylglucosamine--dolichyl-phosphate N-acetylglucosaminephosphotransferase